MSNTNRKYIALLPSTNGPIHLVLTRSLVSPNQARSPYMNEVCLMSMNCAGDVIDRIRGTCFLTWLLRKHFHNPKRYSDLNTILTYLTGFRIEILLLNTTECLHKVVRQATKEKFRYELLHVTVSSFFAFALQHCNVCNLTIIVCNNVILSTSVSKKV